MPHIVQVLLSQKIGQLRLGLEPEVFDFVLKVLVVFGHSFGPPQREFGELYAGVQTTVHQPTFFLTFWLRKVRSPLRQEAIQALSSRVFLWWAHQGSNLGP